MHNAHLRGLPNVAEDSYGADSVHTSADCEKIVRSADTIMSNRNAVTRSQTRLRLIIGPAYLVDYLNANFQR